MELHHIAIRVLFTYLFLYLIIRLSGKQTVGQGHTFDFVMAIILGDLIDDVLWAEVPVSQFITAVCTLIVMQIGIGLITARSEAFAKIVDGPIVQIMRDGVPMRRSLRRERIGRPGLEELLRLEGIAPEKWSQVKSASLNGHGRVAVIEHDWARPPRKKDREKLKKASS